MNWLKNKGFVLKCGALLLFMNACFMFIPAMSFAEEVPIKIKINDSVQKYEQSPLIINGATLVPLRSIFEALGARVEWDEQAKTVTATKGTTKAAIKIGDSNALINQNVLQLEQPAQIIKGNTLVPVRFVSESFGAKVGWDAVTRTVLITTSPLRKTTHLPFPPEGIPLKADWYSFNTDYLQVFYYGDDDQVIPLSNVLDEIYKSMTSKFGHLPATSKTGEILMPVYILKNDDYQKTLGASEDSYALWSSRLRVMIINLKENVQSKSVDEFYTVFRHELTHAITVSSNDSKVKNAPIWFIEGVATFHEMDQPYSRSSREGTLKKALKTNTVLPWKDIAKLGKLTDDQTILVYAEAQSIWGYLVERYSEAKITSVFYTDGEFNDVLENVTARSIEELENDWIAYISVKLSPRNGLGKDYSADGKLIYEGDFKNDLRDGNGVYYYNGYKYIGQFKEGKEDGQGKLYTPDGVLTYEAEFKSDLPEGKGKQYTITGTLVYEGDFKAGKYNGEGIGYYSEGKYIGQYANSKRNGHGKFYDKNGRLQYEGGYKDDKREGNGTLYNSNGTVKYEGWFENGETL
jgi:antitoxin component YwqK of YwqJK toxin-antitoxin module